MIPLQLYRAIPWVEGLVADHPSHPYRRVFYLPSDLPLELLLKNWNPNAQTTDCWPRRAYQTGWIRKSCPKIDLGLELFVSSPRRTSDGHNDHSLPEMTNVVKQIAYFISVTQSSFSPAKNRPFVLRFELRVHIILWSVRIFILTYVEGVSQFLLTPGAPIRSTACSLACSISLPGTERETPTT